MALFLQTLRLVLGADTNAPALVVRGEVEQPLAWSISELQALPRTILKAREKDGTEAIFEGVALSELIKRAKPRLTEKCCGNAANTLEPVIVASGPIGFQAGASSRSLNSISYSSGKATCPRDK
jgi:hypothetical protein